MTRLRYALIVILVAVPLTLSFAIPGYLGGGAKWFDLPAAPTIDPVSLAALQDGYRNEREGNLDAALAKYRIAETSKLLPIQEVGRRAIDRVNSKLNTLGPVYGGLRTLGDWSLKLRIPLILACALILLLAVASVVTRRSGTEVRHFTVIPEDEAEYSIRFDRLLNEEIARIARVFRSDHLRRIGAAVTMTNPKGDSELSGLETRAISAIRQGELKSIIGFWLAEMVRRFQNIGFRPEYVVSGTVVIRPEGANATAQLVRRGTVSALDASSAEAATLEVSEPPSPAVARAIPDAVVIAADRRQNARYLAELARVLACKFFIRWMEIESTKMAARLSRTVASSRENWPASWLTVHDYVRAVNALEGLR
jgi:hypothetical protein